MIVVVQPEPERPSHADVVGMLAELRAEVERLRDDNQRLRAENAELRRRLGLNSTNSSKPPSSDGLGKQTAKPGRTPSRRRPRRTRRPTHI